MIEKGLVNPKLKLDDMGLCELNSTMYNLNESALVKEAISRNEGVIGYGGALVVKTGSHTGRSAKDKFIVREKTTENNIWWENTREISPKHFSCLYDDVVSYLKGKDIFVQDLFACADINHRLNIRVITEFAWHALFSRHLFRIPENEDLKNFHNDFLVINCPNFKCSEDRHGSASETIIAISFEKKTIIITGTKYAGEIKKSIFTVLNYFLPEKKIMPMHCSANKALGNDKNTAVFFGLSGTGKTTLSQDPNRVLIGDDEHGWSEKGIFNFEGGCYAKTINLNKENEPEIYNATSKFATLIENMNYDPVSLKLDYFDDSLTQNMRCAYPLDYISNSSSTGITTIPKNVIFLTCDAFGILPPVAKLTVDQAIYHFISGFTAKIAGTEKDIFEPQPTFSACYGAPFLPRHPSVYGKLLEERLLDSGAICWLVNTGWTGGSYGHGTRMPIKETRAILSSILNGSIMESEFRSDDDFGFTIPCEINGVNKEILNPRNTWNDKLNYDKKAKELLSMFIENFKKYENLDKYSKILAFDN